VEKPMKMRTLLVAIALGGFGCNPSGSGPGGFAAAAADACSANSSKTATVPPPRQEAAGVVSVGPFRLNLPVDWRVVESRGAPTVRLGTTSRGVVALRAESTSGGTLTLWFACPEIDLGGDYYWRLLPDASGRGVARIEEILACSAEEKRKCIEEARKPGSAEPEEPCHVCGIGDGRLAVNGSFAGKTPYANYSVCLELGNSKSEDASREELRAIAMSLRVEGHVGLPEPQLPDLSDLPRGAR
jgi:hypothetical protein